jgi:hypothetical protein
MSDDQTANICEHCGFANRRGALICRSCYRLLTQDGKMPTLPNTTNKLKTGLLAKGANTTADLPNLDAPPAPVPKTRMKTLRLLMPYTGRELRVPFPSGTLMVGRADTQRNIAPDVDLLPFDAHTHGVSRTHVLLRKEGNNILIQDLNSPNGSTLNGKKLTPNLPVLLRHGDVLRLGMLLLVVYLE